MTEPAPLLPPTAVISSTADLIPDGLKGYAKGLWAVLALIGAVLAAVEPSLIDAQWASWVGGALAVIGAVGVVLNPNAVKPVAVDPTAGGNATALARKG